MAAKFYCHRKWTITQRLDAFTDKSGGPDACWPWMRSRTRDGYGTIRFAGEVWRTHQLAWIEKYGPIPAGHGVLHRCDNPRCINPAHLKTGTHKENMADMAAKGRATKVSGAAHYAARLTPDQVRAIRVDARTVTEIAREYGTGRSIISAIRTGKKWKGVV
jgi:hypothetical protein